MWGWDFDHSAARQSAICKAERPADTNIKAHGSRKSGVDVRGHPLS